MTRADDDVVEPRRGTRIGRRQLRPVLNEPRPLRERRCHRHGCEVRPARRVMTAGRLQVSSVTTVVESTAAVLPRRTGLIAEIPAQVEVRNDLEAGESLQYVRVVQTVEVFDAGPRVLVAAKFAGSFRQQRTARFAAFHNSPPSLNIAQVDGRRRPGPFGPGGLGGSKKTRPTWASGTPETPRNDFHRSPRRRCTACR